MSLENGDPGTQALNGTTNDDPTLITQRGRTASTASPIRVLALFPAIAGTDIEAALSKFDARWETSMNWTTTDQPTQGLSSFQNGDQAAFQTSLLKPLPTGGVAGIEVAGKTEHAQFRKKVPTRLQGVVEEIAPAEVGSLLTIREVS